MSENMTYNDLPLVEVRVTAVVSFVAYMVATGTDGAPTTVGRVCADIADAVQYHGGRLTDTEDGDALCAVSSAVTVTDATVEIVECDDTAEEIEQFIEGMAAETF